MIGSSVTNNIVVMNKKEVNMRIVNKGYLVEFDISEYGHEDYVVQCCYKYNLKAKKYDVTMWLGCHGIDDRFRIEFQEIDTQPVTSSKETIRDDLRGIVEYASTHNFFDKYIERYEYTYRCFDYGCENMASDATEDFVESATDEIVAGVDDTNAA